MSQAEHQFDDGRSISVMPIVRTVAAAVIRRLAPAVVVSLPPRTHNGTTNESAETEQGFAPNIRLISILLCWLDDSLRRRYICRRQWLSHSWRRSIISSRLLLIVLCR